MDEEKRAEHELLPLGEEFEPESPVSPADEDDGESDDAVGAVEAGTRRQRRNE